ncbi:hypothetical protein D3C85_1105730 [compost metagenome]
MLSHGGERVGVCLMDFRTGTERGGREIQRNARRRSCRNGMAVRQNHPRTAAVATLQIARIAQMRQRATDRRATHCKRSRQFTFAGQTRIKSQSAIEDQQAQSVRQLTPERSAGRRLLPVAQQAHQRLATEATR